MYSWIADYAGHITDNMLSDEFDDDLEDEDDDLYNLVDSEGNINITKNLSLDEGDYKLIVSADSYWEVRIEEK